MTIKSEDGQGFMGLDMRSQYLGPALARNVTIQGFQYAMGIGQAFSSVAMEHITLFKKSKAGFQFMQNIAWIRDLTRVNTVPVIVATGTSALVVIGGNFSGGAGGNATITFQSAGQVYLCNVNSAGCGSIGARSRSVVVRGSAVAEYSSAAAVSAFPTPPQALMLRLRRRRSGATTISPTGPT